MITPVDLETTVFHRGFRGYNVSEVQEFMVKITQDYEHLYRENIDLKEKIDELNTRLSQYQLMEETLRNAMVLAQETAEEVKNSAKHQAELFVRDAEQKGDRIKGRIKEEIQGEIQKLATLKNQVEFFKSQFKSFLKGLLDIAENQFELNVDLDQQMKKYGGDPAKTELETSPEGKTSQVTETDKATKVIETPENSLIKSDPEKLYSTGNK